MVMQIVRSVGKHKIPRFIYHMTNKCNYESMLHDGVIKTSLDGLVGKGVFSTELTNLFKRWRKSNCWEGESLQKRLIEQVAKGKDEIVILKIPTAKLDSDKLIIRSQNKLFNWSLSDKGEEAFDQLSNAIAGLNRDNNWLQKIREILEDIITKQNSKKCATHLTQGAPARMSKLYKQRKEALEYIYLDNIPISSAEKIGEVNIKELRKTAKYDPVRPMRSIFTELLKGTPEVKGAELLTC